MNICFFCRGFTANGGIGRVTSIVANYLAENEYVNILLCSFSDEKADENYYISPKCAHEFLYDGRITMTKALIKGHAIKKLSQLLTEYKIDIIISCGAIYNPLAVIAARKCKIKVISWEHTNPSNKADYKFQDQSRVIGARFADCNVVLTKAAMEEYNRRFPKSKNIHIYNPVDPELFIHNGEYSEACKKIISVGRLRPQKNFDRMLDIAAEVLPSLDGWTWDVYGEGELREHLQEKRDTLGLHDRVTFMGQVGDLYDRYQEYAFMVMTSDYEGFPMTLLEGAANKLPLVAFDVPTGPSEIIVSEVNGYLCENGDNATMISEIKRLATDDAYRMKMSEGSKDTAESFQVDNIAKQWIRLFEELIG